jgi:hypothetical protein
VIAPLVESARHVVLHADGLRPKGSSPTLGRAARATRSPRTMGPGSRWTATPSRGGA